MMTSILRFINIILVALLAGVSFGIWAGFNPVNLSAATYLQQQQNTIHSLTILMTSLVVVATFITILSAIKQRTNKFVFVSLLTAAACLIACILITILGNKPIDNYVKTWTMATMPDNWTTFRDLWWSFHIGRMVAELIALVLIVWTSVKPSTERRFVNG
jgi:Domain of unknown function (DUF1772)